MLRSRLPRARKAPRLRARTPPPTRRRGPWSPVRNTDLGSVADLQVAFRAAGDGFRGVSRLTDTRVGHGVAVVTARSDAPATPLALETTDVRRGDSPLATAVVGQKLLDTGEVAIDRGVTTEQIKNRTDGVEQSWTFAAEPEGEGDLVVSIAESGPAFVKATDTGLHFAAAGEVGYRYSKAVWRDADGKEFELTPTWDDGRIVITVPDGLLEDTTWPAVLDPTVTPEADVDSPIAGYTGVGSRNASVASDGTDYLVVWQDDRDDADYPDIWGARVAADGSILDTTSIKIAQGTGIQGHPAVAWVGDKYLVAWEDFRTTTSTQADIYAATVSSGGAVTQLGVVSAYGTVNETVPRIAARGTQALVVWQSGADVIGKVFNGSSFGGRITIAATAADEVTPTAAANPAGDYLVAWTEGASGSQDLRGQLVSSAGALSGAAFDISLGGGSQLTPAAAFDGTNFDVVWANNYQGLNIYGTRVDTTGTVLDTHTEGTTTVGGVVISAAAGSQQFPSIACSSSGCDVAWQDNRAVSTNGYDLYMQLINFDFTLNGGELALSTEIQHQYAPSLVATAGGYFAAWHDTRDGVATVFGARITGAGTLTDANGFPIATGVTREAAAQHRPDLRHPARRLDRQPRLRSQHHGRPLHQHRRQAGLDPADAQQRDLRPGHPVGA